MIRRSLICLALLLCIGSLGVVQASAPTFYYVVTAVDASGFESVNSNQATATFNQGQHIVTLTWVAPTGTDPAVSYNVYRGTVSAGPYTKINTSPVTSVTYADTFQQPNAPSGLTAVEQ